MKFIKLTPFLVLIFCSCNNNDSKIKNEINAYIQKNAKDPKSYELVDLTIIDTIFESECATELVTRIKKNAKENIDAGFITAKESNDEITDFSKFLNSKEIVGYFVEHKSRMTNGFGALDLSVNIIFLDRNFKLIEYDANINDKVYYFRQSVQKK